MEANIPGVIRPCSLNLLSFRTYNRQYTSVPSPRVMHSRTEAYRTEIISDCPILLLKYDQTSYPLESYERESVPLPGSRAYRKLRMMSAKVKAAEVFVGWKRTGLSILVVEASKHVVPFRVVLLALLSPSLNDSHHSCYAPTWFQSYTAEFVFR